MLDIGIAVGLALVGFALGYGTREIVSYRRRPPVGTGRLGGRLRPPAEAAKEKPRPPSGLAIGASTWRVEVTLRPPPRDPLKRNSHTLVRLRFIDKDASSKENHCDIFATINRHPKPATRG